jgi:hypothetical protein
MLSFIAEKIKAFFETSTDIDRFINSKCPTNSAEVDYWVREFQRMQFNRRPYF